MHKGEGASLNFT